MSAERLFDLAAEFAQATGNAERCHARAASNTLAPEADPADETQARP